MASSRSCHGFHDMALQPKRRKWTTAAFLPSSIYTHETLQMSLTSDDDDDDELPIDDYQYDGDDDNEEASDSRMEMSSDTSAEKLEMARQQYEQMMAIPNDNEKETPNEKELPSLLSSVSSSNSHQNDRFSILTKTVPKSIFLNRNSPPPLTTILRERRLKEMQLISDLAHSDKAMDELWRLWIMERGPEAAARILRAEELISVESWTEAETIILSLIEEHGIYWAEPVNRLATLYYMLGRYDESKALCELVLDVKPWHFGALSGIVMVCTAMNDASGARFWAENRLPPPGERRNVWTEKALAIANAKWREMYDVGVRGEDLEEKEEVFRNVRAQLEKILQGGSDGSDDLYVGHSLGVWE